jgi:hypothetical protein
LNWAALGVARLFVDKGEKALSDKQKHVLDTHVIESHVVAKCELCGGDISLNEQIFALDDGYCSSCRHKLEKDD